MQKMKYYYLIPLFLCFCLGNSQLTQSPNWSGFRLAQQWPAAYCSLNAANCKKFVLTKVVNFTIHGLWPYDSSGKSILSCPGSDFNVKEIEKIRKDLNDAWPTVSRKDRQNSKFWNYEWNLHGRCSERLLNVERYFETALRLKNEFDVFKILEDAGIVPNDQSYAAQNIIDAIKRKTNVVPELSCKTSAGNLLLLEVRLCVDQSAQHFVTCGSPGKTCFTRSNQVLFVSVPKA